MIHEFFFSRFWEKKDKNPLEKIREITTNVLLDKWQFATKCFHEFFFELKLLLDWQDAFSREN